MSSRRALVISGLLIALALCNAQAAEPRWQVRTAIEFIAIPAGSAQPLLLRLMEPSTTEAAFSEIDRQLRDGQAELLAWPEVISVSGERAVHETVQENRESSDFDDSHHMDGMFPETELQKALAHSLHAVNRVVWGIWNPFAWETRNMGPSLECEAKVEDAGGTIYLSLVAQCVAFDRTIDFPRGVDPAGNRGNDQRPWYSHDRIQTYLKLKSGRRTLLASFHQGGRTPKVILYLITSTAFPK